MKILSGKGARFTLILLTAINLLNYVDRWLVSAVIPSMQTDLHMTNTEAGLVMSAFMLGYFLTSPLFGYLADRLRRLNLVIGGTAVWSLATVVSGFGKTAGQIFLARTVVGVGEASTVSSGQSLIGDLFPSGKRNEAMAYFTAAIPVGAALGFLLGGALEHRFGWRTAFFVAGIPGLLVALLLATRKEPARGEMDGVGEDSAAHEVSGALPAPFAKASSFWPDLGKLWRNPGYVRAVLGYTAYTFTLGGFASWAAAYLVKVRGLPLHEADTLFGGLTVVTGLIGSILGGYLSELWLKKNPRGDLMFLTLTTLLAIPFAYGTFLIQAKAGFLVCIASTEFLLFLGQPAVNVVIMERAGPFLRGLATAVAIFVIHLFGDFVSPPLVGFIADHSSLNIGILILPTALFPAAFFYYLCMKVPVMPPAEISLSPSR